MFMIMIILYLQLLININTEIIITKYIIITKH